MNVKEEIKKIREALDTIENNLAKCADEDVVIPSPTEYYTIEDHTKFIRINDTACKILNANEDSLIQDNGYSYDYTYEVAIKYIDYRGEEAVKRIDCHSSDELNHVWIMECCNGGVKPYHGRANCIIGFDIGLTAKDAEYVGHLKDTIAQLTHVFRCYNKNFPKDCPESFNEILCTIVNELPSLKNSANGIIYPHVRTITVADPMNGMDHFVKTVEFYYDGIL